LPQIGYNEAMPDICLITADKALGAAIAEQLAHSLPDEARLYADPASADIGDNTCAIILDEAAIDKKLPKNLRVAVAAKKLPIFLIGEGKDMDNEFIAESFPKPLRLGHLLARLQFHMQALRRAAPALLTLGLWQLDTRLRQLTHHENGMVVRLTEKETNLLEYLGQSPSAVSREELLAAIWGYDARIDTHTLETHIYRLRRKLDPKGEGPNVIVSEQGAYRLGT
jgi:DNA-binding response OmpR family regulator